MWECCHILGRMWNSFSSHISISGIHAEMYWIFVNITLWLDIVVREVHIKDVHAYCHTSMTWLLFCSYIWANNYESLLWLSLVAWRLLESGLLSFISLQIFCATEIILPSKQWHSRISVTFCFLSHVTQNLLRMFTSPNFCKLASTGTASFSLKGKFTLMCSMFGCSFSDEPTCPQQDTPWGQVDSCQSWTMSEHAKMWQKVVIAVKHGHSSRIFEGEAPTELEISAMVCTCHSPLS